MNRDKLYTAIKNPWSDKPWCTIYTLDGKDKICATYLSTLQKDCLQSLLSRMDNQQLQLFQNLVPLFLDNETLKRIDQDSILSLLMFLGDIALQPSRIQKLELRVGIGLPIENISLRILAYLNYVVKIIQQLATIGFEAYPCLVVYSAANMVLREWEWNWPDVAIPQAVQETRNLISDFLEEALPSNYPREQLYVIQDKKILSPSTQEIIQILWWRLFDVVVSKNPTWFKPIWATLERKWKEMSAENFCYTAAHALYSKDIILDDKNSLFDDDCDSDLVIMIGWPSESSYQFARKEMASIAEGISSAPSCSPTIKVISRVDKIAPYRDERYLINNRQSGNRWYGTAKQELDTLFSLAPRAVEKVLSSKYALQCNE